MYDLKIVVETIEGFCDLPMKKGDYFTVKGGKIEIPENQHICLWALQSLMPIIPAKQREVNEENDWIPHTKRLTCPDPKGRVIFRIDRIDPATGEIINSEQKIPSRIDVDSDKCTGCRACETVCAFIHTGSFNGKRARIKIEKIEKKGKDIPYVCRQCGNAPCVKVCPVDALSRDKETNAILVNQDKCIGCKKCEKACPFDAITFNKNKIPLICDLCGGEVECVKRCPTDALKFDSSPGGDRK
ncbi:MAG: TIGR04076 family protein [Halanaerobiales bacterium]